jgi:hypothetical protein
MEPGMMRTKTTSKPAGRDEQVHLFARIIPFWPYLFIGISIFGLCYEVFGR